MRITSLLLTVLALTSPFASHAQVAATYEEPTANRVFRVDSEASWLRVLAYPDGPLKRFGHHHVIAHRGFTGIVDVAPDPLDSTFALEIAVADLEVDKAEMRALEGEDFEDEVPQKDIDGTRANMLGEKLLHGDQFPTIRIQSSAIEGSLPDVNIVTTLLVKGMEQSVSFPASITLTEDAFVASGELEITHGGLGLSQFTAMGGALSVRDLLVLKYEISGTLAPDSE
ncbi:MAG: YceI family protein [Woeseiaceae bacterium]